MNIHLSELKQAVGLAPKLTVSLAPSMVAIHLNKLSPSGNAEIPGLPDVCNQINEMLTRLIPY